MLRLISHQPPGAAESKLSPEMHPQFRSSKKRKKMKNYEENLYEPRIWIFLKKIEKVQSINSIALSLNFCPSKKIPLEQ